MKFGVMYNLLFVQVKFHRGFSVIHFYIQMLVFSFKALHGTHYGIQTTEYLFCKGGTHQDVSLYERRVVWELRGIFHC
jgi:hypothetical protein